MHNCGAYHIKSGRTRHRRHVNLEHVAGLHLGLADVREFFCGTVAGVIGAPAGRPSRWRMPATAAWRYCSGLSDSSLCVTREKLPSAWGAAPPHR